MAGGKGPEIRRFCSRRLSSSPASSSSVNACVREPPCVSVASHAQHCLVREAALARPRDPTTGEDGCYELEGDVGSVALPNNLSDSIRLRLATVEEQDHDLHTLLKLAAVRGAPAPSRDMGHASTGTLAVAPPRLFFCAKTPCVPFCQPACL